MASFVGGVYTSGDTSGGIYYDAGLQGDAYYNDYGGISAVGEWENLPQEGFAVGETFISTPEPVPTNVIDFATGLPDPDAPAAAAPMKISPLLIGAVLLMALPR